MRILFITCGSIGDAVISTGLLHYLYDGYPQAEFTVAAGPAAAPLFEAFPGLHRLIVIRKQKRKRHWLTLWQQLRTTRWDLVVDLRGSAIGFLLRAKERRIFAFADRKKSKVEQLAAVFHLNPAPLPHLWVSDAQAQAARALLPPTPVVVMVPISNSPFKDWPLAHYTTLARQMLTMPQFATSTIAVLGLDSQRERLTPLLDALPHARRIDLIGKMDLATVCAILKQAQLVIGNDSGMVHMAGALGTKLVGLYGPTNDIKYAPRGPHVRIARVRQFAPDEGEIHDPDIIKQLTVEQVEAAVVEVMDSFQQP
jgi:ADP-heptose:LPS heptosyltransferase